MARRGRQWGDEESARRPGERAAGEIRAHPVEGAQVALCRGGEGGLHRGGGQNLGALRVRAA